MKSSKFRVFKTQIDPLEFAPSLIRLQNSAPDPLGRAVAWILLILLAALLVWAVVGRLDIVAVAEGKLVPQSYVKIVQPAEAGIIKEILVREGQIVRAGQVLMRMDALIAEADVSVLVTDLTRKRLSLRRIDSELSGRPFQSQPQDPPSLAKEVEARYIANQNALEATLAEENARFTKALHELSAAEQVKKKLVDILPHYREQEKAFTELLKEGFVAKNEASDKRRERIEVEQELRTQESLIESARASIKQSEKKKVQILTDYRRELHTERSETQGQADRLAQELAKQNHRRELLELKASQAGTVKDLATHTVGTVVQPGTVLMTLVPVEESLFAEVWVTNKDIGFVHKGQPVKLKIAAFPFQKYGMIEGTVENVSADAADPDISKSEDQPAYRTLVKLKDMQLEANGEYFPFSAGMQTQAEIRLGDRSVLEYLLSPVSKAWHEAGRER